MGPTTTTAKENQKKVKDSGIADELEETVSRESQEESNDLGIEDQLEDRQHRLEQEGVERRSEIVPGSDDQGQEEKVWKMDQESFRIAELNDGNWKSWSLKFKSYMRLQGLWDAVNNEVPAEGDQTAAWKKSDAKALDLIMLRVSDKLINLVSKCEHAHTAYQVLKQHFEDSGNSKMAHLFDKLFQSKINLPSTVAEIAREFAMVRDEIMELQVKPEVLRVLFSPHIARTVSAGCHVAESCR